MLERLERERGKDWRLRRADDDVQFAQSAGLRPMPPSARGAPPHVSRAAVIRHEMREVLERRRAELEELAREAEERVQSVRKARAGDIGERNRQRREMNEQARARLQKSLGAYVSKLEANESRRARQVNGFLRRQWEDQARPDEWIPASTLYAPITSPRVLGRHRSPPRRKKTAASGVDDGAPPPQEVVERCVLCSGRLCSCYFVPDPDGPHHQRNKPEGLDRDAYVAALGTLRADLLREFDREDLKFRLKDAQRNGAPTEAVAKLEAKLRAASEDGSRALMRWCLDRARAMNIHESAADPHRRLCRACAAYFPTLTVLRGAGYRAQFLFTQLSGIVDASDLVEGIEVVDGKALRCPAGHALTIRTSRVPSELASTCAQGRPRMRRSPDPYRRTPLGPVALGRIIMPSHPPPIPA